MKAITKQETVETLKKLFDYENHNDASEMIVTEKDGNTTFMVNKMYMERFEVIDKLQEFFADKYVDKGQVRVESITMVYTVFVVEDR